MVVELEVIHQVMQEQLLKVMLEEIKVPVYQAVVVVVRVL